MHLGSAGGVTIKDLVARLNATYVTDQIAETSEAVRVVRRHARSGDCHRADATCVPDCTSCGGGGGKGGGGEVCPGRFGVVRRPRRGVCRQRHPRQAGAGAVELL